MTRGKIGDIQYNYIYELYGGKCFYCGSKERLVIDHFIPVSRGGTNVNGNLILSCFECNTRASNRLFATRESKKAYILTRYITHHYISHNSFGRVDYIKRQIRKFAKQLEEQGDYTACEIMLNVAGTNRLL